MRRIVTWVASTVTLVVLLFGYHTSTEGADPTASDVVVSATASSGSAGSSGESTTNGSESSGTSSSGGTSSSTITGAVASTRWGPVQVKITTNGTKITAVSVPQYPNGNPRDQEINAQALPILVQETLNQKSADVDMVSGATVTSVGYRESLQSAIDQANL
jgi:uncharacterized protein with FMN-binding domain